LFLGKWKWQTFRNRGSIIYVDDDQLIKQIRYCTPGPWFGSFLCPTYVLGLQIQIQIQIYIIHSNDLEWSINQIHQSTSNLQKLRKKVKIKLLKQHMNVRFERYGEEEEQLWYCSWCVRCLLHTPAATYTCSCTTGIGVKWLYVFLHKTCCGTVADVSVACYIHQLHLVQDLDLVEPSPVCPVPVPVLFCSEISQLFFVMSHQILLWTVNIQTLYSTIYNRWGVEHVGRLANQTTHAQVVVCYPCSRVCLRRLERHYSHISLITQSFEIYDN
jgi:hypothetical protein